MIRKSIKDFLTECDESQQLLFKRMCSHKNLNLPINDVVDNVPIEKLDWAFTQCETTVNKNRQKIESLN